jgi:hypothetical protein
LEEIAVKELPVTNLSYLYKCGKCNGTFNTQEQLKNHQTPCRGKKLAAKLDRPLCAQGSASSQPCVISYAIRAGVGDVHTNRLDI